jgi:SseB protein N-terminal domain
VTDPTPLDQAHALMEAAPGDDALRLRFYERLADAELFLLLAEESDGKTLRPAVFRLEDGDFAMTFDREERLAAFSDAPAPYAALPGRIAARELAALGVGLGLNIGVAPSAFLLPTPALAWLSETLGHAPERAEAMPVGFQDASAVPPALLAALAEKLARLGGYADHAVLAGVSYRDGRRGHMLAFVGPRTGTEAALAKAVSEALVFSGVEAGELDVAFLAADDPALAAMTAQGRRLDLPMPEPESVQIIGGPAAPGMDPDRPPKLR